MEKPDDYIYVVVMLSLADDGERARYTRPNGSKARISDRTVGWFRTFEEADRQVLKYAPWDHLFTHAVVERVPQGFHCLWKDSEGNDIGSEVLQWYRLIREEGKNDWECKAERCAAPPGREDDHGISMG